MKIDRPEFHKFAAAAGVVGSGRSMRAEPSGPVRWYKV